MSKRDAEFQADAEGYREPATAANLALTVHLAEYTEAERKAYSRGFNDGAEAAALQPPEAGNLCPLCGQLHRDDWRPTAQPAEAAWRYFYDDYERGTVFIGTDADHIIADGLPEEAAQNLVAAHNAALANQPAERTWCKCLDADQNPHLVGTHP